MTQSIPGTLQFYQAEYFVGGRDWGTLATGGVNFRYPDWVGNGRVWQDVGGTVTQQAAYAAFGDGLFAPGGGSCCSLQAGMFDDAWQDSANNTYHTLNREYSPTQGRWLTPDPAGMAAVDPTNPQTWNRYAYVTNNPVSFTDPLGLFVQACFSAPGGGGCDLTGGGGGGGDDGSGPPCYMCGGPGGGGGGYGGEPGSGGPSGPTFAAPVFGGGFGAGCGSDFLPCGATPPGLAEILGLPTWDDVLNPIMDAANNPSGPPCSVAVSCDKSNTPHCGITVGQSNGSYTQYDGEPVGNTAQMFNPFSSQPKLIVQVLPNSPPPGGPGGGNIIFQAPVSCSTAGCIQTVTSYFNAAQWTYSAPFLNSNTYASDTTKACGLSVNYPWNAVGVQ